MFSAAVSAEAFTILFDSVWPMRNTSGRPAFASGPRKRKPKRAVRLNWDRGTGYHWGKRD
jgi:hypothetical protein